MITVLFVYKIILKIQKIPNKLIFNKYNFKFNGIKIKLIMQIIFIAKSKKGMIRKWIINKK